MADSEVPDAIEISGFRLDYGRRSLTDPEGVAVPLPAKAFETLAYLTANPGRVVDKSELLNAVWPGLTVEENSLNHAISAIRRALGDSRREPRFIATIQGRGYQLIAPVRTSSEHSTSAITESRMLRQHRRGRRRLTIGMAIGLLVAVTLLGLFLMQQAQRDPGAIPANSVAVLPVVLLNADEAYEYAAPSLHTEITAQLDKIPNLIVIQAPTMRQYEDSEKTFQEIADEVNSESLLTVDLSIADGQMAVNARLLIPGMDRPYWAEGLEYPLEEGLMVIASDLAIHVADALSLELSEGEKDIIEAPITSSEEALTLYLEVGYLLDVGTGGGAALSLEKLDEAVERDPLFAQAWIRKAIAHRLMAVWDYHDDAVHHVNESLAAAQRAVSLDPDSVEARVALSDALLGIGDVRGAYREYLVAREREEVYAMVLKAAGYLPEALSAANAWRRVDPANSSVLSLIAGLQHDLGDPESALDTYRYAKELFPDCRVCDFGALSIHVGLDDEVRLNEFLGRPGLILPELNTFRRIDEDADEYMQWLRSRLPDNPGTSRLVSAATVVSTQGDAELTWDTLHRGIENWGALAVNIWSPVFQEVRRLDAFKSYLHSAGYIDLWRTHGWPAQCSPGDGDEFECD